MSEASNGIVVEAGQLFFGRAIGTINDISPWRKGFSAIMLVI
jgi:hypothetical protein